MARKIFLRSGYHRYSKLGLRRKKKLVYRKAKGRDNKVRLSKAGRITKVKIGFGKNKKIKGLVKSLNPVLIKNLSDLNKLKENEIGVIAKIGNKNKIDIAKAAIQKKIRLYNLNPKKFIQEVEKENKKKRSEKLEKRKKKEEKEKKAKEKVKEEKKEEEKERSKLEEKIIEEKKEIDEEKKEEKTEDKKEENRKVEEKKREDEEVGK